MASKDPPPKPAAVQVLFKIVAIAVGLAASVISAMSAVGAVWSNGYARSLIAIALCIGIPLFLADRLLPDDPKQAKGLVSDVLALSLVGFALLFTTAANRFTRPLLVQEADRLLVAGWGNLASAAYFLAGVRPDTPPATPVAPASGSSSSTGASDAGAQSADPGPADASAHDSGGTSTAADAGARPRDKEDMSPAQLFQELAPSVVTIFVKKGPREGGGTGFVLDEAGTLATNHHVIEGADAVRIKFKNGALFEKVELLSDDPGADLALLRIDMANPVDGGAPPDAPPVMLGNSDKIVVGERAISIGNPLGFEHTLSDGLISARRLHEGRQWIQMSVPISPGNSGGPLFNLRGDVIGITTAQFGGAFAGAQNLNLAVPVNDLKRLIQPSYPQRRKFGDPSSPSQW
jgi:S1-C subfamily serine protease